MLVLSRKKGESVMIGDDIELIILEVEGDMVKVGIRAPRDVAVYRKEVYLSIRQSNEEAAALPADLGILQEFYRKQEKKDQ